MLTGRFRFREHRRFLRPPLQVLEMEVYTPGDQHFSYYIREWLPASASVAADYAARLIKRTEGTE